MAIGRLQTDDSELCWLHVQGLPIQNSYAAEVIMLVETYKINEFMCYGCIYR